TLTTILGLLLTTTEIKPKCSSVSRAPNDPPRLSGLLDDVSNQWYAILQTPGTMIPKIYSLHLITENPNNK
ncbi:MAG: hypothetical protein MHPSP_003750, partial [Paramarteilia canceri]